LFIHYLYKTKFASISTTISKLIFTIVDLLYVDDMDIVLFNKGNESEEEIIIRA